MFFLVLIGPSIVVVFLMGIFQSIRCTRRIVCTLALLTAYLSICVIAPTLMFEWIRLDEGSAPLIAPLLDSSLFVLGFRGLEIAAFRLDRFVVGLWKEWGATDS